jgi:hypothetical protein
MYCEETVNAKYPDLNFKSSSHELLVFVLVLIHDETDRLRAARPVTCLEHVAQGHVLEPLVLADVVVVGDVDARGHTGASEGENVQTREVGAEELVLFELSRPGHEGQQALCRVHERLCK